MEDIKDGEYYRTQKGFIDKIEKIYESDKSEKFIKIKVERNNYCFMLKKSNVVRHSSNIKELISAGDLITYKLAGITHIHTGIVREYMDPRSWGVKSLGIDHYSLEQIEIIDIVTKELLQEDKYVVQEMI